MLYPSVQQMTDEKVNRYALVIATAKGARYINEKQNKEREEAEIKREEHGKDVKLPTGDAVNEKAVSVTIRKLCDGEFTIVLPESLLKAEEE